MIGRLLCCAALLFPVGATRTREARAQSAFGEIRISGGPVETTGSGLIRRFWNLRPGGSLRIEVPFDIGFIDLGVRYGRSRALAAGQPDFETIDAHAGWGLAWRPLSWLSVSAGARVGTAVMRFDTPDDPYGRSESELTLGGAARLELLPSRTVGVFAETSRTRTFTYHRITLTHRTIGVLLRLSAPGWLRRILQ